MKLLRSLPAVSAAFADGTLSKGREVRTATDAQRKALIARDRGCGFHGCKRPAIWTEAHHLDWWDRDQLPVDESFAAHPAPACTAYHHTTSRPVATTGR